MDPSGWNYRRFCGRPTVLTPNLHEAALAAEQPITDSASLELAAARLVGETDAAATRDAAMPKGFRCFSRAS